MEQKLQNWAVNGKIILNSVYLKKTIHRFELLEQKVKNKLLAVWLVLCRIQEVLCFKIRGVIKISHYLMMPDKDFKFSEDQSVPTQFLNNVFSLFSV